MSSAFAFDLAMAIVFQNEGGYTADPRDPGNWTGGKCGAGQCRGSNFGISAKAYPTLDIRALNRDGAAAIYRRDYWDRFFCEEMPPPLALLVFDAAVNGGHPIMWLQTALGVLADGVYGPGTRDAIARHRGDGAVVCAKFMAQRLVYMSGLPTWPVYRNGWATRLCLLMIRALEMGDAA